MKQFDTCNASDKTYFTLHQSSTDSIAKLLMTLCWQVREQLETPQGALLFIFYSLFDKKKKENDPLSVRQLKLQSFLCDSRKMPDKLWIKTAIIIENQLIFAPFFSFPPSPMHYSSPITRPLLICQPGASGSYLCGRWVDKTIVIKSLSAMTCCLNLTSSTPFTILPFLE